MWFGDSPYNPEGAHYPAPTGRHRGPRRVTNTRGSYDYTPCPNGLHLSTVFSAPASRQFRGHPHAKPTDWIRLLIGNCTSSSTILDPFAGSGTTMLACESLGRSAVLVEQSPEYCDVIVSRYRDVAGDTATVERINAR